jgi:hypothetical protein
MTSPIVILLIIAIIFQVLGFVWFGPLFGKTWARLMGLSGRAQMTPEEHKEFQKRMIPTYILSFVTSLLTAASLWFFIVLIRQGALVIAGIIWLGFIVPVVAGGALWSGKSRRDAWTMFGIDAAYYFLAIMISAVVIVLMA